MTTTPLQIGYCITPHGLHAARACAVMEALAARRPVQYRIVSTAPAWFFAESLTASYTLHPLHTDIGLAQHDSFREDLSRTITLLNALYPLRAELLDRLAELFVDCSLVLCDIAPAGIAAAELARKKFGAEVQSVLVENFTWDWIYAGYSGQHPGFIPHISSLQQLYAKADYHIQAEPVCAPKKLEKPDLLTAPIARQRRQERTVVRQQIGLAETDRAVLVTMGGIAGTELPLARMQEMQEFCFVLPGQGKEESRVQGNLFFLPSDSGIWHPDLIAACDAVVGKVGYSTLAEVWQAGVPYGYICRSRFRESGPLAAFIRQELPSLPLTEEQFRDDSWLELLDALCACSSAPRKRENGASAAADFLAGLL